MSTESSTDVVREAEPSDPWSDDQDPWARWRAEAAEPQNLSDATGTTEQSTTEPGNDQNNGTTVGNSGWGETSARWQWGRQAGRDDDNGLMKPGDNGCRALGDLILEAVLKAILAVIADPRTPRPTRVARPGPQVVSELPESGGGNYSQEQLGHLVLE